VRDPEQGTSIVLLTNQFQLSASAIGTLYRHRWQIETFFKWIKQHLRVKAFYGTSPNAVKTQVWIAITVYVLMALLRKQWRTQASLHELLQIVSVTLFEKTPLNTLFSRSDSHSDHADAANQLILFAD
jgi:IS4 transposase